MSTRHGLNPLPSGRGARQLLPESASHEADADLGKSAAHWIDRATVAWKVEPSASLHHSLAFSAKGDIAYAQGDLTGDLRIIRLNPGTLTDAQRAKWPHLAAHAAFTVDPRDADLVTEALRGQVVGGRAGRRGHAADRHRRAGPRRAGRRLRQAAEAELGPAGGATRQPVGLGADRAEGRAGALRRLDAARAVRSTRCGATTPPASGRCGGRSSWKGRYYPFRVTVYAPAAGKVVTNDGHRPVLACRSAADSARSQIVDLADPALQPAGWSALAQAQAPCRSRRRRSTSCTCATSPSPTPRSRPAHRGTYLAFTDRDSDGMRHLRAARPGRPDPRPPAAGLRHRHHPRENGRPAPSPPCDLAVAARRTPSSSRPASARIAGQGRLQLGLRPAALHRARGLLRHRPGRPRAHHGVPADGRRRSTAPACGW